MTSRFLQFLNVAYSLQRAASAGEDYAFHASNGKPAPDMSRVEYHLAQAAAKAGNNTALRLNVVQAYVRAADNPFCPDDQAKKFVQQGTRLLRDEATLQAFAGSCVERGSPVMLDFLAPFSVAHLQVCDRLVAKAFPENGSPGKSWLCGMALNSLPLTLAASYFARIPALTAKMVQAEPNYMTNLANRLEDEADSDQLHRYVARQIGLELIKQRPLVLFNPLSLRHHMGHAIEYAAENPARAAELAAKCITAIPMAASHGKHELASDLLGYASRLCQQPLGPNDTLTSKDVFISPPNEANGRLFFTRPAGSHDVADMKVATKDGAMSVGKMLLESIDTTTSPDKVIWRHRISQLAHDTLGNCCSPSLLGAWSELCTRRAVTEEQKAVARHIARDLNPNPLPG